MLILSSERVRHHSSSLKAIFNFFHLFFSISRTYIFFWTFQLYVDESMIWATSCTGLLYSAAQSQLWLWSHLFLHLDGLFSVYFRRCKGGEKMWKVNWILRQFMSSKLMIKSPNQDQFHIWRKIYWLPLFVTHLAGRVDCEERVKKHL